MTKNRLQTFPRSSPNSRNSSKKHRGGVIFTLPRYKRDRSIHPYYCFRAWVGTVDELAFEGRGHVDASHSKAKFLFQVHGADRETVFASVEDLLVGMTETKGPFGVRVWTKGK